MFEESASEYPEPWGSAGAVSTAAVAVAVAAGTVVRSFGGKGEADVALAVTSSFVRLQERGQIGPAPCRAEIVGEGRLAPRRSWHRRPATPSSSAFGNRYLR